MSNVPESTDSALDLAAFLPYRLSVIATKISTRLSRLYVERFGIAIPEWRIVAVLGQFNDVSADFVCMKTEMDKVTVSRAVSKLLAKRYVTRSFAHEDKRRSVLNLAAKGRQVYQQIVPLALGFERALTAGMGAPDMTRLETLLDKLNMTIDGLVEATEFPLR